MLIMFLIYALLPVIIIINITKTDNKKIKKCRFIHSIPAIILTLINISYFIYDQFYKKITLFQEYNYAFLLPGLSLALVLIIYNSGRKKEKLIQTEIATEEIEKVRNVSSNNKRHDVILTQDEEIEKL